MRPGRVHPRLRDSVVRFYLPARLIADGFQVFSHREVPPVTADCPSARHWSPRIALLSTGKKRPVEVFASGGPNVEIEIRSVGEVKLIKVSGKITLGAAVDRLRENLDELMGNGTNRFLLELAEVPMIDSSGICHLVRYMTTAKQRCGALKLLNPSKFTVQTLKMIGLLNMFEVFQVQDEAVSSFN